VTPFPGRNKPQNWKGAILRALTRAARIGLLPARFVWILPAIVCNHEREE